MADEAKDDTGTTTPPPADAPEEKTKDAPKEPPAPEGEKPEGQEAPEGEAAEGEPDFEDAEVTAAKEDAAKEDAGEGEEGKAAPEGEEKPAPKPEPEKAADKAEEKSATPEPKAEEATDDKGTVMVPKARLDAAVQKGRADQSQALQDAAYWKGRSDQAEQAKGQPAADGEAPAGQQTVDEIVKAAEAKKVELAEKYDESDISASEWEKARTEQDNIIHDARQAALTPAAPSEAAPAPVVDDMYLDQLTAELEVKHPFTTEIAKDDSRWNAIQTLANAELAAEGTVIEPGSRGAFQVRERMAELTDVYGPGWTGKTMEQLLAERKLPAKAEPGSDEEAPAGETPDKKPSEDEKPVLSKEAQARADKLDLADKHPPDTANIGSTGETTEYSDDQIEAMSDDEIAALPKSVRDRILPSA